MKNNSGKILKPSHRGDGTATELTVCGHEAAHAAMHYHHGFTTPSIELIENLDGRTTGGYCLAHEVPKDVRILEQICAAGLAWEWQNRDTVKDSFIKEMDDFIDDGYRPLSDGSTLMPNGDQIFWTGQLIKADGTIQQTMANADFPDCERIRRCAILRLGTLCTSEHEDLAWDHIEKLFKSTAAILNRHYSVSITKVAHELHLNGSLSAERVEQIFDRYSVK